MHHELWLTRLFNDYLAAPARPVLEWLNGLGIKGIHFADLDRPWDNYVTYQILVVLLLIALALLTRVGLSVRKPGALQQIFEGFYTYFGQQANEIIEHHGSRYLPYFLTVFLFILGCNLIGLIPTFHSPTMDPFVPLGCAVATFVYYHFFGIRENGLGYIKQFLGVPDWRFFVIWPLMFVIEILSHLARPMSLTIRLYANMFAGEAVTDAFLALAPVTAIVFMGLHTFVAFLQAFIFTLLTMVYVGMSTAHEH